MRKYAYVALLGAMGVNLCSAQAQEAATAGGDVTADEASPLPPIVVMSPAEPISKPKKSGKPAATGGSGAVPVESETALPSDAGPATVGGAASSVGIFTLGQLDVIGGSTITNEAMWTFNKNTLDQAASIVPGVTMHSTGGSRNERDIFVRGFDRFRVPLSIDGVRIYLPADNRLDFNRFLTPDLSEIQFQKGYVSVLNGPGGMGGAINLVSRKPTKEIELEGRSGAVFDGDFSKMGEWNSYAFAGSRQKDFYAQVSGTIVDRDHWSLSDDFDPVLLVNEDGDERDHSDIRDWRINAKVGYTPNATDEYSINFTTQSGEKSAPLHVEGQVVQGPRYWTWPYWDIQSTSWLSKTQIGASSYVKTNAYYNAFENLLSSFDDATYTPQLLGRSFESYYDDFAYGGFVEVGTNLIPMNTLKAAVHYRHDHHSEFQITRPDHPSSVYEPWQDNIEDTWSFAVENTFHATRRIDIVTGVSYDMNLVDTAQDFTSGAIVENETPDSDAWNGQAAAIYNFNDTGEMHATVSNRTRFPTVFERFSTRFGFAVPNPDLAPERTINYELGWSDTLFSKVKLASAIFYSDLKDSIQPVFVANNAIQNQNISGENYGIEVSVDWAILPGLRVGGNYTYLERDYDYATVGPKPEGTPRHEGFVYLAWNAWKGLTITPSLELASDRNSLVTSADSTLLSGPQPRTPNYVQIGSFALLNVQAEYQFSENLTAAIGGTNLLDEDYALAQGFPEAGRQFYANARARF
jgi:iron complex outermembrane receptor protein